MFVVDKNLQRPNTWLRSIQVLAEGWNGAGLPEVHPVCSLHDGWQSQYVLSLSPLPSYCISKWVGSVFPRNLSVIYCRSRNFMGIKFLDCRLIE